MANGKIVIDPALLMSQSAEMIQMTEAYDHLFGSVASVLGTMNGRWSANLSNNFAAKITGAKSAFSALTNLLDIGSDAARKSAQDFISVDHALGGALSAAGFGESGKTQTGGSRQGFDPNAFGASIKTGANKAVGWAKGVIDDAKKNYADHGWVYDAVEYGKCVLKAGKGIVKIVGAVTAVSALAATGVGIPLAILSSPLAILEVISAGNDIHNAMMDATYVYTDQYDEVGTHNYLKDLLEERGTELGDIIGNRELGQKIGEWTYNGIDIVSMLDGADKMLKNFGMLNTEVTDTAGYSKIWGKTSFSDVLDKEFKWYKLDDVIRSKFMYAGSAGNITAETIKSVISTYKKTKSTIDEVLATAGL